MALDWNREIKLSDFSRRSKGANEIPTKTTMNLYQPVSGSGGSISAKRIILAVLGVVAVVLFVKFGVLDQFAQVDAAKARVATLQGQAAELEGQLSDYQKILADYEGYTAQYASTNVDIDSVFDLVENAVMVYSTVESIDLQDNTLTLRFTNVSLEMIGSITYSVNSYPITRSVSVSTAASNDDVTKVTADMTITLTTQGDQVSEATSSAGSSSSSDLDSEASSTPATGALVAGATMR